MAVTKNPQDAEDALQDTFLRAYLAIRTFEGSCDIYTWLTRIAVNSALMTLRKQRTRAEVLFDPRAGSQLETLSIEVRDSAPNPEESYDLDQRNAKHKLCFGRDGPGFLEKQGQYPTPLNSRYRRATRPASSSSQFSTGVVSTPKFGAKVKYTLKSPG